MKSMEFMLFPALVSNIRCGPVGAEHNRHDMTDGIYEKVGSDTRDRPQSTTKAVRPQKSPATAGFRTFAGAAPHTWTSFRLQNNGVFGRPSVVLPTKDCPGAEAAGIGRRPRVACCHFHSETKFPTDLLFVGGETLFVPVEVFKIARGPPGTARGPRGGARGT